MPSAVVILLWTTSSSSMMLAVMGESCFGTKTMYDKQCKAISTQTQCDAQFACLWGDPTKDQCFPRDDSDPQMKQRCSGESTEKNCDAQIACEWRSVSDINAWITSVSKAVGTLQGKKPAIPSTMTAIQVGTITHHFAHQTTTANNVPNILSAWKTEYNLPDQAIQALQALVVTESEDFKQTSKTFNGTSALFQEIAMGGRNYNGAVQLAFVFGTVSGSTGTGKHAIQHSCSNHNCLDQRIGRRSGIQLCDCLIDGRYVRPGKDVDYDGKHWTTQFDGCSTSRSDPLYPAKCDQIDAPWRALTTDEVNAVLQENRCALFAKIQADATLLENELRNGASAIESVLV
jgi:hypothetical protein